MEERKIVQLKKEEFAVKEYLKRKVGKGKMSGVKIEYTPIGEKITISTHKPGFIIGRKGERIGGLTEDLIKKFGMKNVHIEISEIKKPEFDAQINADEIALSLERFGPLRFKVIAYRTLQNIVKAGALGVEIRLNGKLPSDRARSWRFAHGYLKKTGEPAKVVDRAYSRAETKPGTVGVQVSILSPEAKLTDKIDISDELISTLKDSEEKVLNEINKKTTLEKKVSKKKVVKKK